VERYKLGANYCKLVGSKPQCPFDKNRGDGLPFAYCLLDGGKPKGLVNQPVAKKDIYGSKTLHCTPFWLV
jgi:hypothetical protein